LDKIIKTEADATKPIVGGLLIIVHDYVACGQFSTRAHI